MVIGLFVLFGAILRGDIHDQTTYLSNTIFGVIAGFMPLLISMSDITETIKLISSILALFLVSLSTYRAWKYKK